MLPAMNNPLPGMNPLLEKEWPDVHVSLLAYLRDQLQTRLPPGLSASVEHSVVLETESLARRYRPDIALRDAPATDATSAWTPEDTSSVAVAEPEVIEGDPLPDRWVEIRDVGGRLVTVIEVLSPANKSGEGALEYRLKRNDFLRAGVNVVEIDLLRGGAFVLAVDERAIRRREGRSYTFCATRAPRDGCPVRHAVWCAGLREPLPNIAVPLRPGEADVPLELQPLVDLAWRNGGFWKRRYPHDPEPPLPAEDRTWLDERLRAAGLR